MALITIGTNLIDVADVALVAPSGSTSTVYLADGQQLESALTAAAQATAVNGTAAGTLLTTVVVSSNYGSCYISGPNTQRVVELGATGTTWYLRGGPGPVVCPATDLAAAGTLINATVASGSSSSATSGAAEIVFDYLDNIAEPAAVFAPWTFVGEGGSSTVGVVTLTVRFQDALPVDSGFAQLGATAVALPYPPDDNYVYGTVGGFVAADDPSAYISDGDLLINCKADAGSSSVSGAVTFQYSTGAS